MADGGPGAATKRYWVQSWVEPTKPKKVALFGTIWHYFARGLRTISFSISWREAHREWPWSVIRSPARSSHDDPCSATDQGRARGAWRPFAGLKTPAQDQSSGLIGAGWLARSHRIVAIHRLPRSKIARRFEDCSVAAHSNLRTGVQSSNQRTDEGSQAICDLITANHRLRRRPGVGSTVPKLCRYNLPRDSEPEPDHAVVRGNVWNCHPRQNSRRHQRRHWELRTRANIISIIRLSCLHCNRRHRNSVRGLAGSVRRCVWSAVG
jgi:hypothetical protein